MPESVHAVPRSLADDLRQRTPENLAHLLRERRDLLTPVPADVRDLAMRAGSAHSVGMALDQLTQQELQVLEVLAALGNPTDSAAIAEALNVEHDVVAPRLARLQDLALIWGGTDINVVRAAADTFGSYPCGLFPPASHMKPNLRRLAQHPEQVKGLVEDLTESAQELLNRLVWHGPTMHIPHTDRLMENHSSDAAILFDAGLLLITDSETVAVPREVALPLRNHQWLREPLDLPTPAALQTDRHLEMTATGELASDQGAVDAAMRVLRDMQQLLQALETFHPKVARQRQIHKPDLTRLANSLGWTAEKTCEMLSLAVASQLVGTAESPQEVLAPTAPTAEGDSATHWVSLASTMFNDGGAIVQSINHNTVDRHHLPQAQLEVTQSVVWAWLKFLNERPLLATDFPTLFAEFSQARPRLATRHLDICQMVSHLLDLVGITHRGVVSKFGNYLLQGLPQESAEAFRKSLPAPIDYLLIQPDHTVIAPGRLVPELREQLLRLGTVESDDQALVVRISPQSLRLSIRHGWEPEDILNFLARHSRTPVPQSLDYLVRDVSRSSSEVSVESAQTVLRFESTTRATQALTDPQVRDLRLRRISPDVLASDAAAEAVAQALSANGYHHDFEVSRSLATNKATLRGAPWQLWPPIHSHLDPITLSRALLGEQTIRAQSWSQDLAERDVEFRTLTALEIRDTLEQASRDSQNLVVEVVDMGGMVEALALLPLHVADGFMTFYEGHQHTVRTLPLSRITRIAQ